MSNSAPYRIWKRFQIAQSDLRTALSTLCPPPTINPDQQGNSPTTSTLAHLSKAFSGLGLNPIAAFQSTLQTFFF
jgi:hypothetical protein